MNEIALNSSVLVGLRYDPDHQQLWLRFRAGDLYVYGMVPPDIVQGLIDAPSQGQYFNSAIRGAFPGRRLSLALMGVRPTTTVSRRRSA
jgi:lysyl-tRNA synthetase class 2